MPRFVAYELVLNHAPTLNSLTIAEVEALGDGIASWSDIDCFGCFISGPAWGARRLPDRLIQSWARSEDWCWRRAALVSTVPLRDTKRTLAICRLLVDDREDLVVKALSWALRALSKHDREAARRFLDDYRDRLAARVLREVGNKLTTGLKNPR
jgi:3-methyladenine DNA glycosylase AlkD